MRYNYLHGMALVYLSFGIVVGIAFSLIMPLVIPVPAELQRLFTIASISAGILLGVLNFCLFFAFVRRCITHFQSVLTAVRAGDLSARASFRSSGMIGRMTKDLNRTIAHLEKTRNEVRTDDLTRLPNRVALQQVFREHTFLPTSRYALYFLDVDQFKIINDTYGHLTGDRVLRCVADALQHTIESDHTAYRLSGDEFIVLGPIPSPELSNEEWAERLHERIDQTCAVNKDTFTVRVSVGRYDFCPRETDLLTVLAQADDTMYQAKQERSPPVST
ncbi:GGDEF domain-containing protein [uncultured Marinococcus sp.]|uniref:GGDEF domain-containing protein n=1 Tax=uncultured Marinococcus sp. TaxID=487012 RepID=UPI00260B6D25|nr:diguanylate cyclase [uncultured Marinococcus sp.]